jgi:hypothetical protein
LLVYPNLPWQLRHLTATVAFEAQHYGWSGHRHFVVDNPFPWFVGYETGLLGRYPGNLVLVPLALVGGAWLARRREVAGAWVLVAPIVLVGAMACHQMVQFGRSFAVPVALICVLAGIGAEWLIRHVALRWRPWAGGLLTAALVVSLGSVVVETWPSRKVTAREGAIQWVNSHAPLGATIVLCEPRQGELQGLVPDPARFRIWPGLAQSRIEVGRPPKNARGYVVTTDRYRPAWAGREVARFRGAATWGPQEYLVAALEPPDQPLVEASSD